MAFARMQYLKTGLRLLAIHLANWERTYHSWQFRKSFNQSQVPDTFYVYNRVIPLKFNTRIFEVLIGRSWKTRHLKTASRCPLRWRPQNSFWMKMVLLFGMNHLNGLLGQLNANTPNPLLVTCIPSWNPCLSVKAVPRKICSLVVMNFVLIQGSELSQSEKYINWIMKTRLSS